MRNWDNSIYVFPDGRIVYGEENLYPEETGYVEVDSLPDIPVKDGMTGYYYAEKGQVEIGYFETPKEPELAAPQKPPVTLEEIKELQLIIMGALADIGGDM